MKKEVAEFNSARALVVIHVVLALLLPLVFTQMGGCQDDGDMTPLNLGPEVTAEQIDAAISEPLSKMNPLDIKLGQFFVYSDTQEIAGGSAKAILADTSQTVIERKELPTEVLLTVVQHQQTYQNGDVKKVSTEIPIRVEKPGSAMLIGPVDEILTQPQVAFRLEIQRIFADRSPLAIPTALRSLAAADHPTALSERITYHGLKHTVSMEPPPPMVQQQPNCLDLMDCKIEVHRVTFDMVFWAGNKPDRIHWELAVSPDAPYLGAVLDKCITGLASVGSGQSKILVKQCKPVVNFRYQVP